MPIYASASVSRATSCVDVALPAAVALAYYYLSTPSRSFDHLYAVIAFYSSSLLLCSISNYTHVACEFPSVRVYRSLKFATTLASASPAGASPPHLLLWCWPLVITGITTGEDDDARSRAEIVYEHHSSPGCISLCAYRSSTHRTTAASPTNLQFVLVLFFRFNLSLLPHWLAAWYPLIMNWKDQDHSPHK